MQGKLVFGILGFTVIWSIVHFSGSQDNETHSAQDFSSKKVATQSLPLRSNSQASDSRNTSSLRTQKTFASTESAAHKPRTRESRPKATPSREKFLPQELTRFYVDPKKEEYILNSKLSPSIKRLLLSGVALHNNTQEVQLEELLEAGVAHGTELYDRQDEFLNGVLPLLKDENAKELGLHEDIVSIAAQLTPVENSAIRELATEQLKMRVDRNDVASNHDQSKLLDAMITIASTSASYEQGLNEIKKIIHTDDPHQQSAFAVVQEIIQIKQEHQN